VSTAIDVATAIQIAEEYIVRLNTEGDLRIKLFREETVEREFGWVFFYGPQAESITVAGNAPFIVDRTDGSIHATGTAYPIEAYLESYARTGRTYPFAVPEHVVILEGWKPGMSKVSLTKEIRTATGKGLAEAKNRTDSVIDGKAVTLTFPTAAEADEFRGKAQNLGVPAKCETRYH
jgi:ribosomal protein L7/L12